MSNDAAALAALGGTAILIYSGISGRNPIEALRVLITGKSPTTAPIANPIQTDYGVSGGASPGALGTGTPGGQAIAQDALNYQGHPYLYGGAPGPQGVNPWDCSSFINWVLGHDFGVTLPGENTPGYNGTVHGPTTLGYLVWGGAKTIPYAQAQPGDLAVWQTHIGIFISQTEMISAEDAQLGTGISQVQGAIPGELLVVRRIN
jgi:cell wall-associated NlpC family hydrolase